MSEAGALEDVAAEQSSLLDTGAAELLLTRSELKGCSASGSGSSLLLARSLSAGVPVPPTLAGVQTFSGGTYDQRGCWQVHKGPRRLSANSFAVARGSPSPLSPRTCL